MPASGITGRAITVSTNDNAPPTMPEEIQLTTRPNNHKLAAVATPATPPKRRTSRRVEKMPPGNRSRGFGGEVAVTRPSYDAPSVASDHRNRRWMVVVIAVVVWVAVLLGEHMMGAASLRWPLTLAAMLAALALWRGMLSMPVACLVFMLAGVGAGSASWHAVDTVESGPCQGIATLRTDPEMRAAATMVVVELGGLRHKVVAYGMTARRLARRASGQQVEIRGRCEPIDGPYARRDRIAHIVGRLHPEWVSETHGEGTRFVRAANRIREVIASGVDAMGHDQRALFLGLVIGDDRAQPSEMLERFRASGMSHLCAVSGQNVAFLLLLIRPWTSRRGRVTAWVATLVVIAWFAVVTRAEPSILRASVMAGVVATMALVHRAPDTRSVLCSTVVGLLFIDPMLAHSVGFALSVAATAGLAWGARWCIDTFGGGQTLGATVAAQIGVAPVTVLFFGTIPVVSLLANPLAIPVAGAVMTVGLPLSVLGHLVPQTAGAVAFVLQIPVGWVDGVARFAAVVAPEGPVHVASWIAVGVAGAMIARLRRRRGVQRWSHGGVSHLG